MLLLENFENFPPEQRVFLYPIMAQRCQNRKICRKLLDSIVNEENQKTSFYKIIKLSWLPVLCILDHSSEEVKLRLDQLITKWNPIDREYFIRHIKNNPNFFTYFSNKHGVIISNKVNIVNCINWGLGKGKVIADGHKDEVMKIKHVIKLKDSCQKDISLTYFDFINDDFSKLVPKLTIKDLEKLILTAKITPNKLDGKVTYMTHNFLTVYYAIKYCEATSKNLLFLLGYGEYLPKKYKIILQSIHEFTP